MILSGGKRRQGNFELLSAATHGMQMRERARRYTQDVLQPLEAPFEQLVPANIVGLFNVFEAARKHKVRRVVYASSSHVVGFHRQSEVIGVDAPLRPDCLYAVTKCFGEALSRYYFDRCGIETVCLRIGTATADIHNGSSICLSTSGSPVTAALVLRLKMPRKSSGLPSRLTSEPVTIIATAHHSDHWLTISAREMGMTLPAAVTRVTMSPWRIISGARMT